MSEEVSNNYKLKVILGSYNIFFKKEYLSTKYRFKKLAINQSSKILDFNV